MDASPVKTSATTVTYRRSDAVLWRRTNRGTVLLAPDAPEPFLLTGSGPVIWELLSQAVPAGLLADLLAEVSGVQRDRVAAELDVLLMDLVERGAVTRG